ncbi:MAG TPA: glycosyltransferase family 1 protein [Bacteroidales bacterium]|mgnify:CR=1 FL=1|nr:glycosyltransferase family 1 protein [Bacteroidales bacterium]HPS17664.1 glycosyltransferase family 1 protein [Bacteroidales bacterium]
MKRTVYINARFLTQRISGVQRFAYEISQSILNLDINLIFLAPQKDSLYQLLPENAELIRFGKYSGHIWEQFELPNFLKKKANPLLINLCNTAPIIYNNKISTVHDIAFIRFKESFSFKFRIFYKFLIPRLLNSSKAIITVSEFSKGEISSYYGINKNKIIVVPNAVSSNLNITENKKNKKRYLLTVSSIDPRKNLKRLIEAFNNINDDSIELLIIGSQNSNFKKNYELVNENNIKFLGYVSDDELAFYYEGAIAFIYPSIYEGFGIPPLEAMRFSCPVLVSDIPVLREVCNSAAMYFDPYNIESISNAIRDIVANENQRINLIKLGTENVKRFNWDKSAKKLLNIINNL